MALRVPHRYRVRTGLLGSTDAIGNNGMFDVPTFDGKVMLTVLASDQYGWEHVSVSTPYRTPTWDEMQYIKTMFWEAEDVVLQIHPPQSEYVNCHPYCLHLWRQPGVNHECPSTVLLSPK